MEQASKVEGTSSGTSALDDGLCILQTSVGVSLSLERYNELAARRTDGPWRSLNFSRGFEGSPDEKETDQFVVGKHGSGEHYGGDNSCYFTRQEAEAVCSALNRLVMHNVELTGAARHERE